MNKKIKVFHVPRCIGRLRYGKGGKMAWKGNFGSENEVIEGMLTM